MITRDDILQIENAKISLPAKYSQYDEESIILYLFNLIEPERLFFVDLGAGLGMSNTKRLREWGWAGLCVDMEPEPADSYTIKEFIKPSNIVDILKRGVVPKDFDFLSIDLDSFDFDVLSAVLGAGYTPKVICTEFNPAHPRGVSVKLRYEDGYTWDGTQKYGYSFDAGLALAQRYGYTVIHNHINLNLFMVHNSLIEPGAMDGVTVKFEQTFYHPPSNNAVWDEVINL